MTDSNPNHPLAPLKWLETARQVVTANGTHISGLVSPVEVQKIAKSHNEAIELAYELGRNSMVGVKRVDVEAQQRLMVKLSPPRDRLWTNIGTCTIGTHTGATVGVAANIDQTTGIIKAHNASVSLAYIETGSEEIDRLKKSDALLREVANHFRAWQADPHKKPDNEVYERVTAHMPAADVKSDGSAPTSINKDFATMTDAELRENFGYWALKAVKSDGWGSGANSTQVAIRRIKDELKKRGLL